MGHYSIIMTTRRSAGETGFPGVKLAAPILTKTVLPSRVTESRALTNMALSWSRKTAKDGDSGLPSKEAIP